MPGSVTVAKRAEARLKKYALGFPEAYEDHPWGESVAKVGKKVFAFMGLPSGRLTLSVKLPESQTIALMLPFTEPTGYGLGKSGWVTATFEASERPPVDLLEEWIEESYRTVAPKKLSALLDGASAAPSRKTKARTSRKRSAAKK